MKGEQGDVVAGYEALRDAVAGEKPARKVRGSRRAARMIAANVTDHELSIIVEHATRGGYLKRKPHGEDYEREPAIAEYVRAVCLSPRAKYDTNFTRIAKPLSEASYRISRALDALRAGDVSAGIAAVVEAQRVIAAAMTPLRRGHDAEVRGRE